jgi:hypothetical protein
MRYNSTATTQAKRPWWEDKFPSGSAFTCTAKEKVVEDSSDDEHSPAISHQKPLAAPATQPTLAATRMRRMRREKQ